MIVCHCRGISTADFETEEELVARLSEDDWECGSCLLLYAKPLTIPDYTTSSEPSELNNF